MNNSIIVSGSGVGSAAPAVSSANGEMKYLQLRADTNTNNFGLNLDQSQLLQITQLINDLQQQNGGGNQLISGESLSLNDLGIQLQQQQQHGQPQFQNMMEIVVTSPHTANPAPTTAAPNYFANNTNNSIILSPSSVMKLDPQQQYQTPQQIYMAESQQQDQTQVHTIMLNGQPALFIPASSAISSNLLCQMLMNNNNNNNNNNGGGSGGGNQQQTPQSFEMMNAPIQLSSSGGGGAGNNGDFSAMLANQLILAANNEQSSAPATQSDEPGQTGSGNAVNILNLAQVLNNCDSGLGQQQQSGGFLQIGAQSANSDEMGNFCKMETIEQPQQMTEQNQQQIICINPDGNITFQTLPFLIQQQQPAQQQQAAKLPVYSTPAGKKRPKCKVSTVASALAGKSSPGGNSDEAAKGPKADSKSDDKSVKAGDEQWTSFLNESQASTGTTTAADAAAAHNTSSCSLSSSASSNDVSVLSTGNNDAGMTSPCAKSAKLATVAHRSNEDPIVLDSNGFELNDQFKRKRKACDCPNCIKWRQNAMTPDEMSKKRTHKCHKCTKEYNKTSHLRAHLRAHDNYRPYVCDFKTCGKSFTRSDELKRHKRIHNDDRNFACAVCKKKFLRSDHLNKHLLVHNKPVNSSSSGGGGATASHGNQENQPKKKKPVSVKPDVAKKTTPTIAPAPPSQSAVHN